VRHYKKKTDHGSYGSENLNLALEAVKNGIPLIKASKQFGIPARTPGLKVSRVSPGLRPGSL